MQIIHKLQASAAIPEALRRILPIHLLAELATLQQGSLEELCLRREGTCYARAGGQTYPLAIRLNGEEIGNLLQKMCAGSLYAFTRTINQGFLTMEGGIRVGVCGSAATEADHVIGVSHVTSLILRIPHEVRIDTRPILERLQRNRRLGGFLIYAPPGVGKTTLLRALAGDASAEPYGWHTVVIDSREELLPLCSARAANLDVLRGYPRQIGMEIAVRSLGAELMVCDEIGNTADADAVLAAANCGVPLIASAHAGSILSLLRRPALRQLHDAEVFGAYIELSRTPAEGSRFRFYTHREASDAMLMQGAMA